MPRGIGSRAWTWITRTAAVAAALHLLAGCGGGTDTTELPPPPTTTTAAPAETTEGSSQEATEPIEPNQFAGDFAKAVVHANFNGQYGKVWNVLHPDHRALTTREKWEACRRADDADLAGVSVEEVRVLDTYSDPYEAPEIGHVDATAVTLLMRYTHPLLEDVQEVRDTVPVVNVDGEWRGLWTMETHAAYVAGRCPE